MITRTIEYRHDQVVGGIETMEEAGWSVRQIVVVPIRVSRPGGGEARGNEFIVVYERDTE